MRYLRNVSTVKLNAEKCTGCARCVEVCPRGVLAMSDKKALIVDRDLCIECGACAKNCEFGALAVASGVGCASALFTAMRTGGEPVCECGGSEKKKGGCC
jgi:NAD-dependent dihydropyrimidine dehydrogenase PreA subunit